MAISLRHVGIVVSDLEKSIKLYQYYLGCELVEKFHGLSGQYQEKMVGIKDVVMDVAILRTQDDNRIELLKYKNCPGKKESQFFQMILAHLILL